jgi:hypothetical protein
MLMTVDVYLLVVIAVATHTITYIGGLALGSKYLRPPKT